MHTIEEVTGMGSYLVDLHLNKISFSEGMYKLLGEARDSGEPGPDFLDPRSDPEDTQKVRMAFEQARKDKNPYYFTHRIRRNVGECRLLPCHGQVMTDGEGNAIKLFGVV